MLTAIQGSPMANSESLKNKAQGKGLIYRQVGHWTTDCPNCDKSPKNSLLQMSSIETLGGPLPLGPESLKVKCQAFPHDGSTGLKWPAPPSLPVTDNHHGAGAKAETGCGR